jgi:hypothetical protein
VNADTLLVEFDNAARSWLLRFQDRIFAFGGESDMEHLKSELLKREACY